tara:strand:+ start:27 stop:368 length:342 start_codon:yes stop_codon:yes gene_type:complete
MNPHCIWTRADHETPYGWRSAQRIYHDRKLGLLSIEHDGSISWDELQWIKDAIFGTHACAIEVYPPASHVVNNIPMRHLWLLGPGDWWPDLGHEGDARPATLRERFTLEAYHG